MNRYLKYIGMTVGLLLALVVVLALALVLLVDPNAYKPQIIRAVKQKTDMDLALNDKLGWTFWPALGVRLGKLTLTDPALNEQLLAVNSAAVSVQLLPLLSHQITVNTVLLDGAAARYVKYADGSASWDHLLNKLKSPTPTPEEAGGGGSRKVKLSVNTLSVTNTSLTLVDDKARTTRAVTGIDLQASNIAPDRDFPLALKFVFSQNTPGSALSASTALATTLRMNPAFDHIVLHGLKLDTSLTGGGGDLSIPESVSVQGDIDADLAQKLYKVAPLTLSADYKPMIGKAFKITLDMAATADLHGGQFAVSPLKLAVQGLTAEGELKASVPALAANARPDTAVTSGMVIAGRIATNTFDPHQLLGAFNISLPATSDPAALSHVSLRADIAGTAQSMLLKNLRVGLDSSTLSGEAGISDLASGRLYANLNLDRINLDNYLPPPTPATAPTAPAAAPADGGLLPVELIRKQNADLTLGIGALTAMTYPVTGFHLAARADHGLVTVSDLKGNIYGGSFSLPASINAQGAQPVLSVKPVVNQISVGPIADKILKKHLVEGTFSFNGSLGMTGNSVDAWKRSLGGNANLALTNGVMHGVNMMALVVNEMGKYQVLLALAGKNATTAASSQSDTPIGQLTSVASISNGVVNQTSLQADLQKAQLHGTGTFNLVTLDADYHLVMNLDRSVLGPKFAGYDIPVRCKGNVAAPAKMCGVDSGAVQGLALKAGEGEALQRLGVPAGSVQSAIATKKEEVKQQVQQKAIDQLNKKLPGALKGLFGQ